MLDELMYLFANTFRTCRYPVTSNERVPCAVRGMHLDSTLAVVGTG
jgi:hypothetical protein